MSAAVVIHSGSYPYPLAVLSRIVPDGPAGSRQEAAAGRPCRHATHMRGADGSAVVFALDGPLRERAPVNRFPSVRLRLRGARPLHATTASTWDARREDQLAAYFTEASTRYRSRPAAGRWVDDDASATDFPDDPTAPRPRPLTVGGGTGNRKNLSCVGRVIASTDASDGGGGDATVVTESESRAQFGHRRGPLDAAATGWSEQHEEVRRHRERMRQSAQVAELLAPADADAEAAALAGDARSRFWSESARAAVGGLRRCSTAPAQPPPAPPAQQQLPSAVASFRRVSGNRVLSRIRDLCADMPVIF